MPRKLTSFANSEAVGTLDALVDSAQRNSVPAYRTAMTEIGRELGKILRDKVDSNQSTYLAFTVEDADYLAKGLMDELIGGDEQLAGVACFWNARYVWNQASPVKTTPIMKSYTEPAADVKTLIIVKSIISSACVVKTNLTKLIGEISPERILIVAPVMYEGSQDLLRSEFSESVSSKFTFYTFAVDDVRLENGNIEPGIGGSVYEKLGFGDSDKKNTYLPQMVKERRALYD